MTKPKPRELSDTHRRGIRTTLVLLDETLCHIEQWAKGREMHSVLYGERNRLTPAQKASIIREIEEMRKMLDELRQTLGLECGVTDGAREIWAMSWGFWEHLEELHGKHLRRYGEPPEWLSRYLDPKADELIEHLQRIAAIAGGNEKAGA